MSDSIEREALRLCDAILEQQPEHRETWLREQCGSDTALYERTRRLLDYVQATDHSPAIERTPAEEPQVPPPEQLGAYKVLGLIGRGGMGAVYKGERADGAFERTVAIKLVGAIHARSDAELRFTNERQILARMRHPNIAQLLDGGTVDERGYLVMEFVDGVPFNFDEHRTTTETLNSFAKVCAAVQYAHNNLVLHRDLKPDNVLLDKSGEPKLLDFGIAKLSQELTEIGSGDVTGTTAAPLTLNYSAPERLLGEPATVSSDVYSLGVFLYVLLHGVRPYDLSGKTLPEAWKQLRERTTKNAPDTFGDLGLIAEKAMHSDAESRYASAAELAADIERFQTNQTVSARQPDWRYSVGRFIARNKLAATASVLSLLALLAAFALTSLAYLESERQTQIAETEATIAGQAVNFLGTVLSSANPYVSDQKDLSVNEVLQFAKQKLELGDIENPIARAYVETSLAMAHDGRGEFDQALDYADSAVEKFDAQNINSEEQRYALYVQALVLVHSDKPKQALDILQRFMQEAQDAGVMESWAVVEAETLIGNAQENLAEESQALITYESAQLRADRQNSENLEARIVLLNNYGRLLHQQGAYEQAVSRYQESLELTRRDGRSALREAVLLANLAGIQGDQQAWPEAIELLTSALKLHASANNLTSPDALISRTTLANFQRQSGDLASATQTIKGALETVSETLAEDHFITAYVQNVAAVTLCDTDQWTLGLDYAKRSLITREKIMPAGHWILSSGRSVLGKCETRAKNYPAARLLLTQALQELTELRGADGTQTRQTQVRLDELVAQERANGPQ